MCGQTQTKQIGYVLAANIKELVHPKYFSKFKLTVNSFQYNYFLK